MFPSTPASIVRRGGRGPSRPTRRSFLSGLAAALGALPFVSRIVPASAEDGVSLVSIPHPETRVGLFGEWCPQAGRWAVAERFSSLVGPRATFDYLTHDQMMERFPEFGNLTFELHAATLTDEQLAGLKLRPLLSVKDESGAYEFIQGRKEPGRWASQCFLDTPGLEEGIIHINPGDDGMLRLELVEA